MHVRILFLSRASLESLYRELMFSRQWEVHLVLSLSKRQTRRVPIYTCIRLYPFWLRRDLSEFHCITCRECVSLSRQLPVRHLSLGDSRMDCYSMKLFTLILVVSLPTKHYSVCADMDPDPAGYKIHGLKDNDYKITISYYTAGSQPDFRLCLG